MALLQIDLRTIKDSIEYYGKDMQSTVCMEECAELIQAISKVKRYGTSNDEHRDNLIEEIADVKICLEMLELIYNISDDEIYDILKYKQNRIKERMNK